MAHHGKPGAPRTAPSPATFGRTSPQPSEGTTGPLPRTSPGGGLRASALGALVGRYVTRDDIDEKVLRRAAALVAADSASRALDPDQLAEAIVDKAEARMEARELLARAAHAVIPPHHPAEGFGLGVPGCPCATCAKPAQDAKHAASVARAERLAAMSAPGGLVLESGARMYVDRKRRVPPRGDPSDPAPKIPRGPVGGVSDMRIVPRRPVTVPVRAPTYREPAAVVVPHRARQPWWRRAWVWLWRRVAVAMRKRCFTCSWGTPMSFGKSVSITGWVASCARCRCDVPRRQWSREPRPFSPPKNPPLFRGRPHGTNPPPYPVPQPLPSKVRK